MREIKFRAWDGIKLIYQDGINYIDFRSGFASVFDEYNYVDNCSKDININSVMQYTELKDKNGKEIYEGDILKGSTKGNPDEVLAITYVKWDRGQFDLYTDMTLDSWEDALYNYMQFFDVEVIGNIYENPELLEGDVLNV